MRERSGIHENYAALRKRNSSEHYYDREKQRAVRAMLRHYSFPCFPVQLAAF
jgi:hypothetical protein